MAGLVTKKILKPSYLVPVAGWVGCVLLLQYTLSGMEGHMLVRGGSGAAHQVTALQVSPPSGETVIAKGDEAPAASGSAAEAVADESEDDGSQQLALRHRI